MAGCALLSFLDCYSGYHQITLAAEDQKKTAFITPFGAYCYTSMSFGLKNIGATYQRVIQTCLTDHWGKRVEAYVDDVVIKTKNAEDFIDDLQQVFDSLRKFRWKLNPTKCVFGVPAGQLLGFVVSNRGIEANPKKVKAILRMHPPRSQKDAQRLTGYMAALSRLISRLNERDMPFYKLLKKLRAHEENYPTHDLELAAVVHALKIWRHYLMGNKCKSYTDHKSLKYIFTQTELNMRQRRWLELIKDYELEIHYHPRKENIVADALSRKSYCNLLTGEELSAELCAEMEQLRLGFVSTEQLNELIVHSTLEDQIREAQKTCPSIAELKVGMERGLLPYFRKDERGAIWLQSRLCIPQDKSISEAIMTEAHCTRYSIHPGSTKMYRDLKKLFW
ncbi:hypothetical protein U9M48_019717 [Paspalum notatum var. saurae]|uniref:Reverse transcriptase n=1 Tax=Paspalum notatum var. saurae TaxID=547442 RepID=A0AAQ3TG05_PASNO